MRTGIEREKKNTAAAILTRESKQLITTVSQNRKLRNQIYREKRKVRNQFKQDFFNSTEETTIQID
jgi:hypothetical protein